MPDLWSFLSFPLVDLLGWTLLHFVWQGALMAAGLAGALFLLRNHAPRVGYLVSCGALLGLLALPVGTGLVLSSQTEIEQAAPASALVVSGEATDGARPLLSATRSARTEPLSWQRRAAIWLQPVLPWVVLGWGVGVLVFSIRLVGGAWRVRRVRRRSAPASSSWRERLHELAERMGLARSVALRQSTHLDGPVVAGWWRPVVLVPTGLLTGLPPDQVEALLLHELAHIRRHDVFVGRVQAMIETLLFFHPATWWISSQVRRAREACCDDLVVQEGTDRTVYARALTALAERAVTGARPAGALAASDGSLLTRIRRLLAPEPTPSRGRRGLSMAAAVLLVASVPVGLAACASQQSASDTEQADAGTTATVESVPGDTTDIEKRTVVVVQDDSTRRAVTIRSEAPVEVDSLDDGAYIFRYDGEHGDTIKVPIPDPPADPNIPKEAFPFDPDSLERALHRQINPDSLERVLRRDLDPDSLKRALEARLRSHPFLHRLDSLEKRKHPALDRLLHHRLRDRMAADSLRRRFEQLREEWEDTLPERFRERAQRLREQAERLEERARSMEQPPPPSPTPPHPAAPEVPNDTSETSDASEGSAQGRR